MIKEQILPTEQCQLDDDGFLVLRQFIDRSRLETLTQRVDQLFAEEGERAGSEFKQEVGCRRLANLIDKGEIFHWAAQHPRVLQYVRHVLGPEFKLSSLNVRSVNPHFRQPQPLHTDMGAVPDEKGYWVFNTVWLLDDITAENGALRVVPGSHRWRKLPQLELADPTARHPDEVLLTGRRGDLFLMNAHLWHGGLGNSTDAPRTAMHVFYVRRDKPQQQYQKRLVRTEVQQGLSDELHWLLALDDPQNDELCRQFGQQSGFLK